LFISDRLKQFIPIFTLCALLLAAGGVQAQTQAQSRILSAVKNEERVTVTGSTSPLVKASVDTGRMSGGQSLGRMLLVLSPTADQEQQAAELIAALHDSASPSYHKWLTPAQYGQQFGVTAEDATTVQQWLQTHGLTVHEISQSRRFVVFSGTVGQVEEAFSTEMHAYSYNDNKFIANSTDVQIPAALAQVVKGVVRLHSDPRTPNLKIGQKITINKKTGKIEGPFGLHIMAPSDFATIYNVKPLYAAGIDGTGETIAIVTRSSLQDPNYGVDGIQDIRDFRNVMNLPANDPQMIVNGDDPQVQSFDDTLEALLDITWAGAVAPGAHIIAVASQSDFEDGVDISAAYIVDHNLAPIMSTSFGTCEQNLGAVQAAFYDSLWQQAAAQGITSFVSAGDNGGAGCDSQSSGQLASQGVAVNGMASTPYNVAVGGTQFDDVANNDAYWTVNIDPITAQSALSYIPEIVWNESSNDPFSTSLWAGSGGVSTIYKKPDWQTAFGVPNDGKRDLPDISLAAAGHTSYALCFEGSCSDPTYASVTGVSGTSAASPAAAGIMALVLQQLGGKPQGLANYVFYKLSATPGVYHDIIKGDNKVPDINGQFTVGYPAGTGYDLASGIGSFDANALVTNWASASATAGSATTLTLGNGQATTVVHGTPITFKAKVACSGSSCSAPTGAVSLLSTGTASDTLGVGSVALTTSGSSGVATIASPNVPGGTYGISARYSGDGKYYSSTSNSLNVTVTPEPSQTQMGGNVPGNFIQTPLSVSYGEPVTLWVAVAGASGVGHPTGLIDLLVDGNPASTTTADYQSASTLTLNYGESATVFGNGTKPTGQSSVLPNVAPGLTVGPHQFQANYPGDNSFNSSQATYTVNIIKAVSGISDVFLAGTAVPNVPVDIDGQIVLLNLGCSPYGGTVSINDYTSGTAVSLGPPIPVSSQYCDSFTFTTTFKTAGQHLVRVSFSGDSNVTATTSTGYLTVSANTSPYMNFTADVANTVVGGMVNLSAQVSSDVRYYTATGSVAFLDGANTIGTVKLDGTGTANLAISTLAAGTHTLSASYAGDAVLTASTGGPITEMIADYTVQSQPANLTLSAGQSGSATINVIPLGGSTQTVSLACGNLPTKLTCAFSPPSVTLDGVNAGAVKITVSSNVVAASAVTKSSLSGVVSTIAFAALFLPFGRRKRLKHLLGMLAIVVFGICAAGCGGGSGSSTPAAPQTGTYVLNITTSAGPGTAAKTIPLVVTVSN
jgi:Pro-kumamolisin, activation domain/Bacterial Ig-like domain (group 3)